MTGSWVEALLERAPGRLDAVARMAGFAEGADGPLRVVGIPGDLTNMTTQDLARVRFGTGSLVVKIAQSPRHSPIWDQIPEDFREQVFVEMPWRAEPAIYASPLGELLPDGIRMPQVYAVDELGDDRIAIWMEDVADRTDVWGRDDYRVAAMALGRLAGVFPEGQIPSSVPVPRRDFRGYFFGRVTVGTLPVLRNDATWRHPFVADVADARLRADLHTLASIAPQLLDHLDDLPRTLAHGDACPQNLLRPIDEPDMVVAIDWTFAGVTSVGMDAGQLLAGRAESGELDPSDLGALLDDVIAHYLEGLASAGWGADPGAARFGVLANLVVRSAFTALPIEWLDNPQTDELASLFAKRAAYARFLVDLGLDLMPHVRV